MLIREFPASIEVVKRIIDDYELDLDIRTNYEGRSQVGECVGFVGSTKRVIQLLMLLMSESYAGVEVDGGTLLDVVDNYRVDDMGRYNYIIYFPGFKFAED